MVRPVSQQRFGLPDAAAGGGPPGGGGPTPTAGNDDGPAPAPALLPAADDEP